jgi:hypothetical protein
MLPFQRMCAEPALEQHVASPPVRTENERMIGRAIAAAVAAVAAVGLAALGGAPAWADGPVPLDPDARRTTARLAEPADPVDREVACAAIADFMKTVDYVPRNDVDGWTFALPADVEGEFAEVRLTFTTPDVTTVEVKIPGVGDGWLGHLGSTGGGTSRSAYLVTPADWMLVGGEATVSDGSDGAAFTLGTTCGGLTPDTADTGDDNGPVGGEAATLPTGSPSPTAAAGGAGDRPDDGAGGLPSTGMAVGSVLLVGAGLIAAGVALVGLRPRRDVFEAS